MQETKNDLISIIMPVRNGENYLDEALKAVKSQNVNVEIIVVDDASSDRTSSIAKKHGCIVLRHESCRGAVAGKNTGLKAARGDFVMFYDHDDVLNKGALRRLLQELKDDSSVWAVMGQLKDFISPDAKNQTQKIREKLYGDCFSGAVLIRKEVFAKIGLFDENLRGGDFLFFQTQMLKNSLLIKKVNVLTCHRRIHDTNYGKTNRQNEYKDYLAVLRTRLNIVHKHSTT